MFYIQRRESDRDLNEKQPSFGAIIPTLPTTTVTTGVLFLPQLPVYLSSHASRTPEVPYWAFYREQKRGSLFLSAEKTQVVISMASERATAGVFLSLHYLL